MKTLIICVLLACVLPAVSILRPHPPLPDISVLQQRIGDLSDDIRELSGMRVMPPVHLHWERVRQYVSLFGDVQWLAVSRKQLPGYPHVAWVARLTGPVLPVLTAAYGMQSLAPVYLKKMTIRDGHAELSLHIFGGAQ